MMKPPDKKFPHANVAGQPYRRPTPHAQHLKPTVAQSKSALPAHALRRPVAPPVYRPQSAPPVAQRKVAVAAPTPKAPPAYRPQAAQKVLQTKMVVAAPTRPTQPELKPPTPFAHRPQPAPTTIRPMRHAHACLRPAAGSQTVSRPTVVQMSSETEWPSLGADTKVKLTRKQEKKVKAESKEAEGLNAPETWWKLFGLGTSSVYAKTLGIDNYGTIGAYRVHVTLYKVNSKPQFFAALSEDQIMDALLGSEKDAQGADKKGIHVTLERPGPKPRCFRGDQFVNCDAKMRDALGPFLDGFLGNARRVIRAKKKEYAEAHPTDAAAELGASFMQDL